MLLGLEDCPWHSQEETGLGTGDINSVSKAEGLETDHPRETEDRLGLAAPGNIGAGDAFQEMPQTRHHLLLLTAVGPAVPRRGCKQLCGKVATLPMHHHTPCPHVLELFLPSSCSGYQP